MANVYVDSAAVGLNDGSTKADAYASLSAALAAKAAGDTFWVRNTHSELPGSALTLAIPGTAAAPCGVYSVTFAGSTPPVAADLLAGALVGTTGNFNVTWTGFGVVHGVVTKPNAAAGTGAGNITLGGAAASSIRFINCNHWLRTTQTTSRINLGATGTSQPYMFTFINTTVQFSAAAQAISLQGTVNFKWRDTPAAIAGATFPTTLFAAAARTCRCDLRGVDLSAITGTIFANQSAVPIFAEVENCNINAAAVLYASQTTHGGEFTSVRADNAGTSYKNQRSGYGGDQTVETTIVRAGGANDGTTAFSWKVVTNADAKLFYPLACLPLAVWNDTIGVSRTLDIFGVWGGGAVPNNNDVWFEAEYLGDAASPKSSFVSAGLASPIATPAAHIADSSSWGGSTTKFKMRVTFTPQLRGPVIIRVYAAVASTTLYIDPKPVLS